MHTDSQLKTFAAAYCDILLLDSLLRMRDFFANDIMRNAGGLPVWLLAALLIWGINRFFLKQDRSLTVLVVLNLVLAVPELWLIARFSAPLMTKWSYLFLIAAVVAVHIRIVNRFFEPVSIDSCIRFFEMSVVVSILCMAYQSYEPTVGRLGPQIFSALVVSLAAVIAGRIEGAGNADTASGKRGLTLVMGILAAAGAVCVVFAVFFSDSAGSLIARLAALLLGIVRGIGAAFTRFLGWLLNLFPEPEAQSVEMPEPVSIGNVEIPETAEYNSQLLLYLGIAAVIIVAVLFILMLWRLRKLKAGPVRVRARVQASAKGGSGLREMLMQMLQGFRSSIEQRILRFRMRNTVPGLAMAAEQCFRGSAFEKKKSESYSAYLRRLADAKTPGAAEKNAGAPVNQAGMPGTAESSAKAPVTGEAAKAESGEQKEWQDALRKLAGDFESMYFAGGPAVVYTAPEAADMNRAIRKYRQSFSSGRKDGEET